MEQDARSFGSYANSGGWMFGLMVARCVQPQNVEATHKASSEDKISAKKFALMAGTSAVRVMRFYRAWERAAEAGVVPSPGLLTPGQEIELPEPGLWGEYFTKYEQSSDRRESIALQAEIAGTSYNQAVRVAENPAALRTAILGDPKTAEAARAALADRMQDDVELQARLAQTIVQTPDLRKAVTAESRRVEHVALLRRAIDSGTVKTPAGQIIELPEDVKKKVAEHLTDIENAPAQSESGEAYEAFRQIVTETIEANPQLLVSERRHKLYGRIQKAAKAFSDLDPKEVEKLGEDDLVQTLEEIQEVIGDLLSNARRNRRPLRSVNSES
ncbi:hypothetical protein ACIBK9_01845 [Nonomuraea sp. NPDC050227]|uniref:hypothetical protein n=1 Tax=Nonomuraea sp. NPDC050227 TaxID=3364360 RepID=UPI0037B67D98